MFRMTQRLYHDPWLMEWVLRIYLMNVRGVISLMTGDFTPKHVFTKYFLYEGPL